MRHARIKPTGGSNSAFYHCISRVVERRRHFGDIEKEKFVALMREYEVFCDVRVLTYCIMSNHFHILVEIPARPKVLPTAEELIERLKALSGTSVTAKKAQQQIDLFRSLGDAEGERVYLDSFFRRMWDVSEFMKLQKQTFSSWFNGLHDRKGTLWEERFKSVLVEGNRDALATMAAYIDLNPLRAKIVKELNDYRWCGYAAAMAGDARAQAGIDGIARLLSGRPQSWDEGLATYRCHIFGRAMQSGGTDAAGQPLKPTVNRERALAVIASGGAVPLEEFIQCRVKGLVDGLAMGSREFVAAVFERFRSHFGSRPRAGVHGLAGLASPPLFTLQKSSWGHFRSKGNTFAANAFSLQNPH